MGFTSDGADIKQLENLLDRHNIVYVKPNATFKLDDFYKNNLDIVKAWIKNSYPLVVARQENIQNGIKLAVATVEKGHKIKAAMLFESADIIKIQLPPTLKEISEYFGWQTKSFEKNKIYIYGSYAISYLTKKKLFTETSDIDLLLIYQNYSLATLDNLLNRLQECLNCKVDIEVRFKNIGDINLRELISDKTNDLICKTKSSVYAIDKRKLYELEPTLYEN
ncbi:phosphoribosyl-dephospho-CoA transferase MdcG domain-containing protein [Francisella sp. 19X1-34]|uniref:phosphoribosyl-dephospho-CoA transferase MdcG domain-containing protein n=1 Tax=Francisella sp. 19X1-34 TaxID=3087177 RepID=UPI002E2F0489|nr:phosphoribosyl-dephospho-CoA transferase MdcG domain-containing protein [Francisella sp. 19X1-34]MED7787627.1 malonate decarboxylase holo-[acyl-carrier-protein] synthase [Francisella sp. 19X1-34]